MPIQQITLPSIDAWFSNAFPDKNNPYGLIPDNSFIDKGITGLGITHAEMWAKRHSLIPMPYKPIIECKRDSDSPYQALAVMEGVDAQDVAIYLQSEDFRFKKILVTPDSFWKVIDGARIAGKLDWLYNEVFCYVDEVHCYAIDAFRENILNPFKYIWRFKHKAFGSATPYPMSNPLFSNLQHYKIRFAEKLSKVRVMHHSDPMTVLHDVLTHPDRYSARVFIFLNSVTATGKAIMNARVKDVAVFCSEVDRNMKNLGDAEKYFRPNIEEAEFRKFNLLTGRYFEGFDLKGSPLDTIILVTDTTIEHTMVGIEYRGVQAVGRLRLNKEKAERPQQIIHITNTLKEECMADPKQVYEKKRNSAEYHIADYNEMIESIGSGVLTDAQDFQGFVSKFAYFKNDGTAHLFHEKIDQQVYAATFKRSYNSTDTIVQRWRDSHFDVELVNCELPKIKTCRKSDATINKEVIELFETMKSSPVLYNYAETKRKMNELMDKHNILFQCYFQFGKDGVEGCDYDNKKMMAKLIKTSNDNKDTQLRLLVAKHFTIGFYTKAEIKIKMQQFYNELEMKNPDGKRKVAKSEELRALKMFSMKETKKDGKHGFEITGKLYTIKQAA